MTKEQVYKLFIDEIREAMGWLGSHDNDGRGVAYIEGMHLMTVNICRALDSEAHAQNRQEEADAN